MAKAFGRKTLQNVSGMLEKPIDEAALAESGNDWDSFLAMIVERWSGGSGERKQDRSKRRELEILRAALQVFARDGISRARIGDIAAEAGMPVSSIYEYFPSKEDLAYAVPTAHLARFFSEYTLASAGKTTCYDRLRLYLWLAADFARRNPEWARTLYLEIWPSVMVTETAVRHSLDDYVRVIVRLLREGEARGEWPAGQDLYQTAAILNGSVNQLIITWLLYRKPRDLMKATSSILDRTMRLLTEEPAGGASNEKAKTTKANGIGASKSAPPARRGRAAAKR